MVEGTEFAGHKLAVDDRSVLLIDCANHDERIFDASNRLNFCRDPNPPGVPFGLHFCLEAAVACLEARHALPGVLRSLGCPRVLARNRLPHGSCTDFTVSATIRAYPS